MSFAIVLEPEAEHDLRDLPATLQARIADELNVLAAGLAGVKTVAARVPYPSGQLFRSEFPVGDVRALMDVVFQFGQDETTLHILRIYIEFE